MELKMLKRREKVTEETAAEFLYFPASSCCVRLTIAARHNRSAAIVRSLQ